MAPNVFAALVAAAALFSALALGSLAVYGVTVRSRHRLAQRIAGRPAEDAIDPDESNRNVIETFARSGRALGTAIDRQGELAWLLVQAGARDRNARAVFYGMWGAWGVACATCVIGALLFNHTIHSRFIYSAFTVFIGVALVYVAPMRVLRMAAAARRTRIRHEVPLFIHLLVLLFETGLSTRQALISIVREGAGVLRELGKEFENVLRQLDAGAELSPTLLKVGEILDVDDLKGIIGILRQVDRFGGEIREPLLDALAVIQERASLDTRERVNLISGRMTVVMVSCFLPALLSFTMAPGFMAIMRAFKAMK